MTVKELIEELKKFPEDMKIVIGDSEYPVEEISGNLKILKNFWIWDGPNHTTEDVLEIQ